MFGAPLLRAEQRIHQPHLGQLTWWGVMWGSYMGVTWNSSRPESGCGLGLGGSGDVLAGFLGGFLAQPQFHDRVIQAAAYAVWQHGHAADRLEATGRYWGMDALIDALAGD